MKSAWYVLLLFASMTTCLAQDLATLSSQRLLSFSGSLNTGLTAYNARGIDNRQKPFSWQTTGQLIVSVYGIAVPFTFTLSEKERSFRQPFNQFGLSPSYRWATLHGGYRSPVFAPLVFGGQSILCWGAEMNPWLLRTGFVQGRFQRAVPEDTLSAATQTPAFERNGYAAKLGFGSADNYTDVALVRASDNAASLSSLPVKTQVLPGENAAIGLSSRYRLFNLLSLEVDAGYSAYTRDQQAPAAPLPNDIGSRLLGKMIRTNSSTLLRWALQTAVSLRFGPFDLGAEFKRIDPEYRTMGIAFSADDVAAWGGRINWSPYGPVRASASFARQRDNLRAAKKATTVRSNVQTMLGYAAGAIGVDLTYGLTATSQKAGSALLNDTTAMSQDFHTIGIAPRLTLPAGAGSHTIAGNCQYQMVIDHNRFTRGQNQSFGVVAGLMYTLARDAVSVSLGTTLAVLNTAASHSRTASLAPAATWSLFQKRLALTGTAGYSQSYNRNTLTGRTVNSALSSQYRPGGPYGITAGISFTRFMSETKGQSSFGELKGELSYALSF